MPYVFTSIITTQHYLSFSLVHTEDVACPQLQSPMNGAVSVDDLSVDSVASYTCDTGYLLTGPAMRTCGGDGQWIGSEPSCQSVFGNDIVCMVPRMYFS